MTRRRSAGVDRAALKARLQRHVDVLAGLIGPRHDQKPASMEATRRYLREQWEAMSLSVEAEAFESWYARTENLIVERPGTRRPERVVILGAHYDTVPETPGADDNASAVAGLLEACRLLVYRRHAKTVRFVAFANEEPPHFDTDTMGSDHHAKRCLVGDQRIDAMLCLEMIGYFTDRPQDYPPLLPRVVTRWLPARGDFLAVVSNLRSAPMLWPIRRGWRAATGLRLVAVPLPETIHEIKLSDHRAFWERGYRAAMATDTSFFRNPNYHRETDTPETLDYDRLTEATLGIAGATLRLAGGRW